MILPGIEQVAYDKGREEGKLDERKKFYHILLEEGYSKEKAKALIKKTEDIEED